jgi:hypothetical protein
MHFSESSAATGVLLVGDSHKGPLNNRGNPLKTHKKCNRELTHEPKTHALNVRSPGGPRGLPKRHSRMPPRARSASLEGCTPPRVRSASLKG